jgi:hypothetical protein
MNQENFQAQQNEVVSSHDQRELEIDLKPFFSFAESIWKYNSKFKLLCKSAAVSINVNVNDEHATEERQI